MLTRRWRSLGSNSSTIWSTRSTAFSKAISETSTLTISPKLASIPSKSKLNCKKLLVLSLKCKNWYPLMRFSNSSSKICRFRARMRQVIDAGPDSVSWLRRGPSRGLMYGSRFLNVIHLSQSSICLECQSTAVGALRWTTQGLSRVKTRAIPTASCHMSIYALVLSVNTLSTVVRTVNEPTGQIINQSAKARSCESCQPHSAYFFK